MRLHDERPSPALCLRRRHRSGRPTDIAQLHIIKRHYIANLPKLAWNANFYTTSDLH